jgi:F0F1-type ATP synthase membrane subunit b/b'
MESLFAPSFNLLILIVFLVYKLRQPVKDFVSLRHKTIREEIQTVRQELQVAQEKYDEFSSKLKAIDAEVVTLREQSQQEISALKQRILSESRRLSLNIISDAKAAAENLYLELKGQLYSDLSAQVLDRAELILRDKLTSDNRLAIRNDFSKQLEAIR